MSLITEVGSFTIDDVDGIHNKTVSLSNFSGIVPLAGLFWIEWTDGPDVNQSFGFLTGEYDDGVANVDAQWTVMAEDNQGSTDVYQMYQSRMGAVAHNGTSVRTRFDADTDTIHGFNTNEFRTGIKVNATGSDVIVHYMIFGGTDLTDAQVVNWNAPATADSSFNVTGAGFTPDAAITLSSSSRTSFANGNAADVNIGLWTPDDQVMFGHGSRNARGSVSETAYWSQDKAIYARSSAGTLRSEATLTAFNSDGAELDFTTSGGRLFSTLFLKGGKFAVGTDQSPTSAGDVDSPIGFSGHSAFYVSCANSHTATFNNQGTMSIGGSDGTNHHAISYVDQDNVSTSNVVGDSSTSHSLILPSSSGVRQDSATTEFSGNNLRTAFDVADGTQRTFAFMAFGDAAAAADDPIPRSVRLNQAVNRAGAY